AAAWSPLWCAMAAVSCLVSFCIMRAISYHHVDVLLGLRLPGVAVRDVAATPQVRGGDPLDHPVVPRSPDVVAGHQERGVPEVLRAAVRRAVSDDHAAG